MILTTKPGKGGRFYLYCDEEYFASVTADMWYSLGVTEGQELDDGSFAALKREIEGRQAYASAVRMLTLRAHARRELGVKLSRKFSRGAVDYALDKCAELGFLDDRAFAKEYARSLWERKRLAPGRIRQELASKGVTREIADEALAEFETDPDEAIAEEIERLGGVPEDKKERQKLYAKLLRAGWSAGDVLRQFDRWEDDDGC